MPEIVIPLNDEIDGMASLSGLTPVASKYYTRLLREYGCGLWPEIGRGRRGAVVSVRSFVAHWAAINLCRGQQNESPRAAHEFSLLQHTGGQISESTPPDGWDEMGLVSNLVTNYKDVPVSADLPSSFLIDEIAALISEAAVKFQENDPFVHEIEVPSIEITLGTLFSMDASVRRVPANWKTETRFYHVTDKKFLQENSYSNNYNKLAINKIIMGGNQLRAMAQFVAQVGEIKQLSSSMVPGSAGEDNATPETTKPAGTGIHDGLQKEGPAPKAHTALPDTEHCATGKGRKQTRASDHRRVRCGPSSTLGREGLSAHA